MSDEIVTIIVEKANAMRSDGLMFSVEACRSLAEQLEKLYPGCVKFDEDSQSVIYTGPGIDKNEKYDRLLPIYGRMIAEILNSFMKETRPGDWDGPKPLVATKKTGEIIIEDWISEAVDGK